MAQLQEQIAKLCPQAQLDDSGEFLLVTVDDAQWHDLAVALKEQLHFDTLAALVGVDWKDSIGCMYYLTNSENGDIIHIKVSTTDRETTHLTSVSDVWAVANYQEREAYDFFGIRFIGHPDMRRFFLRNDWKGYPLRKDYAEKNDLTLEPEVNEDETSEWSLDEQGKLVETKKLVFDPDEYVINVGPQHPSTHGVMRYRASLDGEMIKKVDVVSGYIHRGIEKLCENLTYLQTLLYTERMDYMSAS